MQAQYPSAARIAAAFFVLGGLVLSITPTARAAVAIVFDTPETHTLHPFLTMGAGELFYTAVQAKGAANVQLPNSFEVNDFSGSKYVTGVEASDTSSILVTAPIFKVTSYGDSVGLRARDQTVVTFSSPALILGRGVNNAAFARLSGEAKLLFSGQVSLTQDSNGEAIGVHLANEAFLSMTGTFDITDEGNFNGVGVRATDSSEAVTTGSWKILDNGNGDAVLVQAQEQSTVSVGGHAEITDQGNGNAYLVDANGTSRTLVTATGSVHNSGNGNAVGVRAAGKSFVDFHGNIDVKDTGNGGPLLFDLSEEAQVAFNGNFRAEDDKASVGISIRLAGRSSLHVNGGFLKSTSGVDRVNLLNDATMTWSGGQWDANVGQQDGLLFRLSDASTLRVRVQTADQPLGLIEDLERQVTGVLADGNPFSFRFTRSAGASVFLVPEPSTCALLPALALALAPRRRRRSA